MPNHQTLQAQRKDVEKEKRLEIANCANCAEIRDLKNDRNAVKCYEHNQNTMEIPKNLKESIKIILDFVERFNKQDKERDVAEAAEELDLFFKNYFAPPLIRTQKMTLS